MQKEDNNEVLDFLNYSNKKDDGEGYFEYLILRWVQFWPLLVVVISLAMVTSWGYLRYTPRVYQSKAQILIKEDKSKQSKDNILDALDLFGTQIKVENEIAILKSKYLMREVVGQLKLYAQLNLEGKVEKLVLYGNNSPLEITAYKKDSLKPYGRIIKISDTNVVWGNNLYPYDSWCSTPAGILKFSKGPALINPNKKIQYILSINSIKSVASYLSSQLEITPVSKQSTVLQLTLTDIDVQRAQDVLNTLIKSYADDDIFDKNRLAQKTIDFLNERLNLVSSELENVESELQRFKQVNKAIDLTGQSQHYLSQLEDNDRKSVEIDIQLTTLKQVEAYINRKKGEDGAVPALYTLQDNLIKELLTKLLETEFQYNKLVKSAGQNAPNTQILEAQLEIYRKSINENLNEQKLNLIGTNEKIKEKNRIIQLGIANLPSKEKSLLDISRRQTVKDNLYSYLLQKREETQLSYASALADSRVIDAAESSSSPIRPESKLIYAIGICIAMALFVVIIGSFQIFWAKLMFKKELEMFVGFPIIASIGKKRSSSSPFIFKEENNRSWLSEQFRNLRTDIAFLGFNGHDKKVLLITSSIPGEGKTFISLNLANAASLTGLKVILISADLRNPKIHEFFSISQEPGLVNYLAGLNSIEEIICKLADYENLNIIPSGTIPPNPSELLGNNRMTELMFFLKNNYDLIIFDSTPCELVTDAKVLAKHTDATIIVTRFAFTPLKILKKVKELSVSGVLPNPTIVFNAVNGQGLNYGYGYSYGYGNYKYGYSSRDKKKGEELNRLQSTLENCKQFISWLYTKWVDNVKPLMLQVIKKSIQSIQTFILWLRKK